MKISEYIIDAPCKGLYKQHCILVKDEAVGCFMPLVYLQRPKWIKDDAAWEKIVKSVRLTLPRDFEVI